MPSRPDPADVARFRALLTERLGLRLEERPDALADVLADRVAASGAPHVQAYLERVRLSAEELEDVAPLVTVGETYFFRNPAQFRALAEIALPERIAARGADRRLRILSAGCATGEEAYSLAIQLREVVPAIDAWDARVDAIDLNVGSLARAVEAEYGAWSLRATSADVRDKWFQPSGSAFRVDPIVKRMVAFGAANLASDDAALAAAGGYDVVFCRNVLMYFAPERAASVVRRLHDALAPSGFLFLGHAETLRGLSDAFDLRGTHDTFYYRRRGARGSSPRIAETSWVAEIDRASKHIAALGDASSPPLQRSPSEPAPAPQSSEASIEPAMAALRDERYADGLGLLEALPAADRARPEVLLLRAVLLTDAARTAEAASVCAELLAIESSRAAAHYLLALHAANVGDDVACLGHACSACAIAPDFALARMQVGLAARRLGDAAGARRALREASERIPVESERRVALFGGGFSRDALVRLCQRELEALDGAPPRGWYAPRPRSRS